MPFPIKRVVPLDDPIIQRYYLKMLEYLGNPEVVEDDQGIYRFRPNGLYEWIARGGVLISPNGPMNDMMIALHQDKFTPEEMMRFYMGLGYSLSGFDEIWGEYLEKTASKKEPN